MCVFSHWIPFRFRFLSTCSSTYYLYIFRKAGRAPEPVECSPVSDSRSRASDAWHGPVSRWWWKNTWQNNHHLVFFFPLGGRGWRWVSFHVVFFWFIGWLLRGVGFDDVELLVLMPIMIFHDFSLEAEQDSDTVPAALSLLVLFRHRENPTDNMLWLWIRRVWGAQGPVDSDTIWGEEDSFGYPENSDVASLTFP